MALIIINHITISWLLWLHFYIFLLLINNIYNASFNSVWCNWLLINVKLLLRLSTGSACLWGDTKRYKMIVDEMSVIYESGAGEDVEHLLITWGI